MTSDDLSAAAAGSWTLGDLTVNRIGFGAMRLPQFGRALETGAVPRDRDRAVGVLRRAVELGVNHIDTAAFYFSALRSANELINRALSPYRDDIVIATKVGPGRDPSGEWLDHAGPGQLRGQVEENLRQLGRDHLDLVNLRVLGTAPVAERFGVLAELREAGLIRHLGLSNVTPEHLAEGARHRSGWPGPCTGGRTCWPSPAPGTPPTSRPTWLRARCGCRRRSWRCWRGFTGRAGSSEGVRGQRRHST